MKAEYLVRFDDICPTMDWAVWRDIEKLLLRFDIRPLLAVVPDNHDERLSRHAPKSNFWSGVRRWAKRGWTIGMHGFRHEYLTTNAGVVGKNSFSEFAGVGRDQQETRLRHGMNIFKNEGVKPTVWVAPGHSFDATTLELLRALDIRVISDGYALYPALDPQGMLWIPQQLWAFRSLPRGVWTVCLHHNDWRSADFADFQHHIERRRASIVCTEDVIARYGDRTSTIIDRMFARAVLARFNAARMARAWVRQNGFELPRGVRDAESSRSN